MKQLVLLSFFLVLVQLVHAQKGNAELMAGNHYLHYQHSISQSMTAESRFGWQHIATLIKRYETVKGKPGYTDELMNQAYITYAVSKTISLKTGLFYTNTGGYKPSVGMQAFFPHKHGTVLLSPRINVADPIAYELFVVSEYLAPASGALRFVVRVQAMSNASSKGHNRSYQLIRLGVDINNLQLGGGLTLDEFGSSNKVHGNAGIFIRKKW